MDMRNKYLAWTYNRYLFLIVFGQNILPLMAENNIKISLLVNPQYGCLEWASPSSSEGFKKVLEEPCIFKKLFVPLQYKIKIMYN